jgi:hypothetical protein
MFAIILTCAAYLMLSYGANFFIPKNKLQAAGWIGGGVLVLVAQNILASGKLSASVLIPEVPPFWSYAPIALAFSSAFLPVREYIEFHRTQTESANLREEIEQFQIEYTQKSPIDTDMAVHQRNLVQHRLWGETEFKKRFTKTIRRLFPRILHAKSTIPWKIEMEADDYIRELARNYVPRDVFIIHLKVITHASFSFPDRESSFLSARKILSILLAVWIIAACMSASIGK